MKKILKGSLFVLMLFSPMAITNIKVNADELVPKVSSDGFVDPDDLIGGDDLAVDQSHSYTMEQDYTYFIAKQNEIPNIKSIVNPVEKEVYKRIHRKTGEVLEERTTYHYEKDYTLEWDDGVVPSALGRYGFDTYITCCPNGWVKSGGVANIVPNDAVVSKDRESALYVGKHDVVLTQSQAKEIISDSQLDELFSPVAVNQFNDNIAKSLSWVSGDDDETDFENQVPKEYSIKYTTQTGLELPVTLTVVADSVVEKPSVTPSQPAENVVTPNQGDNELTNEVTKQEIVTNENYSKTSTGVQTGSGSNIVLLFATVLIAGVSLMVNRKIA